MRLPDFFVIGAAKAGTTSLHAHLAHHPDLFMSRPKEPEFFARDDLYAKGIESYAPLFEGAQPGQLCGESSTIYTLSPLFPETAARVQAHVPEAKFVYMMREPVARAYSFYVQLVKNRQNETHDYSVGRSFEEFLYGDRAEIAPASAFFAPFDAHLPDRPELLTAGSLYLMQIESWLAQFPRERFLFLTFESFIRDQKAVTEQVLRFLGVDPARMPDIPETSVNRADDHMRRSAEAMQIQAFNARLGPLAGLRNLLPSALRKGLRQQFLRRNPPAREGAHRPAPLAPQTALELERAFYADLDALVALTGIDPQPWLAKRPSQITPAAAEA